MEPKNTLRIFGTQSGITVLMAFILDSGVTACNAIWNNIEVHFLVHLQIQSSLFRIIPIIPKFLWKNIYIGLHVQTQFCWDTYYIYTQHFFQNKFVSSYLQNLVLINVTPHPGFTLCNIICKHIHGWWGRQFLGYMLYLNMSTLK
jgi:hypothetical protein